MRRGRGGGARGAAGDCLPWRVAMARMVQQTGVQQTGVQQAGCAADGCAADGCAAGGVCSKRVCSRRVCSRRVCSRRVCSRRPPPGSVAPGPRVTLRRRQAVVRIAEEEAAFFALDVGADLANLLGRAVAVEVVVLRLEVHPHLDQDLPRAVVRGLVGDAGVHHRKRDGEVERVEAAPA